MRSFFVQPDKQQTKGSAIMFIFSEVYGALELGIGVGTYTAWNKREE